MWDKLYIAATEGTSWPLDLDTAEAQLRERFPDAVIGRQTGASSGQTYVSFDADVNGMMRHGIYVEGGNLTLSDGEPADWAETIAWFLSLLPSGTPVVALAERNPNLVTVPANASADEITQLLDGLAHGG